MDYGSSWISSEVIVCNGRITRLHDEALYGRRMKHTEACNFV